MINTKVANIPAGIEDGGIEIFATKNNLKALIRGKIVEFEDFPISVVSTLRNLLDRDIDANFALDELGITDYPERLKTYSACRFGGFNNVPDIDKNGNVHDAYWNCGNRGSCPFEGRICKPVTVKNGVLSKKEIQIIKTLSSGDKEPVVAENMGISFNTLVTHKYNINKKMGVTSKFLMIIKAMSLNLIST
jgi:DNA-binding CsgD family transcriptional regulator